MKVGSLKITILFNMTLFFVGNTVQAETSLGIMSVASQQPYKATQTEHSIFPRINRQGEHVFFRFPEVGYRFLPNKGIQNITVGFLYDFSGFDPNDSSDENIQKLDEREDSIMAFTSYRLGIISAKLAQDVSGKHDGYYTELSAAYPIPVHFWRIIPSISSRYINSKMSNYLFGVSQNESDITSNVIESYNTNQTSFMRYGITGIYPVLKNANFIIGINYTKFDDNILASPIIDDNTVTSLFASFVLSF